MTTLVQRIQELWDWLTTLPADFAFLLSLPFAVALAGLLAELGKGKRTDR
jgi:hypothetical protein